MIVSTPAYDYIRASQANMTGGAFAALLPQSDNINDDAGAFQWQGQFTDSPSGTLQFAPNAGLFLFYGKGADNATFSARVTAYSKFGNMWIPNRVFEVACLLSTVIGGVGQDILDTERFADTVTKTSGPSNMEVFSPADNGSPGHVLCDALGGQWLKLQINLGTATDANMLIKRL